MRRQDDDEIYRRGWSSQHHIHLSQEQQNTNVGYYVGDEIERRTNGRGVVGFSQYQDLVYPFSYVMVSNDEGQEQQYYHHYNLATDHSQQMIAIRPPTRPQTPAQLSVPHLMLSSPPPQTYFMHHQPQQLYHQQLQPSPSPLTVMAPTIPQLQSPVMTTIGCNTNRLNSCTNYSGESNKAGTAPVAVEITKDSSSTSYVRRVPMDQPIPAGMSSTVIVNDNNRRQQSSNDDGTTVETITSAKQSGENEKQNATIVDDNKVIAFCKRTIMTAINKIIVDDYRSALSKLRKSIRILDILMFNESGNGIGSAKVETVKPWLETLKDIERRVSSKHHQRQSNDVNHSHGSNVMTEAEFTYCQHARRISHFTNDNKNNMDSTSNCCDRKKTKNNNRSSSCSSEDKSISECHYQRQSNVRRYRTTGKIIVKQRQRELHCRRRYRWKKYLNY